MNNRWKYGKFAPREIYSSRCLCFSNLTFPFTELEKKFKLNSNQGEGGKIKLGAEINELENWKTIEKNQWDQKLVPWKDEQTFS